jgi:transketolase
MRNAFAETLYGCATRDPRLAIVVADISPAGNMAKFREEYPERFINVGVAEQVMIGFAAGLALRGFRPFAYTIATFSLYRPFEMVRDDLCYQNLPVTVVGMGAGVTYSTLGSTHHAQEDIALTTALPNMTVLAPCDPAETALATAWCAERATGPCYLRLGKAGEPSLTDQAEPWQFGKIRALRRGADVCILSYGPILKMADDVAKALEMDGKSVSLMSVHTMKPLDRAGIAEAMRSHRHVIVIEEMVPHGGLASRAKEIAWDSKASCRLDCFTLDDSFRHVYGSSNDLLSARGLSIERILAGVGTP